MIIESEAYAIAKRYIEEVCAGVAGGVLIIEDKTVGKPYGWIFFYNSKRYLETRHPLDSLAGGGPVVVKRVDGSVHQLGTALHPDHAIAEFERQHRLK